MKFEPLALLGGATTAIWKLSEINPADVVSGGWNEEVLVVPSQMRVRTWLSIWAELFQDLTGLHALEIGVFRGGFLRSLVGESNGTIPLKSWTGVDPYLGTEGDPYLGAYWKDEESAGQVHSATKKFYDSVGQRLLREKSEKFFEQNSYSFDLIYVDGDHTFKSASRDLESSWSTLKPGGLLMFDDYGNSDTPDVTKAANNFMKDLGSDLDFGVFFGSMFRNSRKHFPVVSFQIGLKKATE